MELLVDLLVEHLGGHRRRITSTGGVARLCRIATRGAPGRLTADEERVELALGIVSGIARHRYLGLTRATGHLCRDGEAIELADHANVEQRIDRPVEDHLAALELTARPEQVDITARRLDRAVEPDRALAERKLETARRRASDLKLFLQDLDRDRSDGERREQPWLGRRRARPELDLARAAFVDEHHVARRIRIEQLHTFSRIDRDVGLRDDDVAGELRTIVREVDRDIRTDRRLERAHEGDVGQLAVDVQLLRLRAGERDVTIGVNDALAELS